MLLGSTLFDEMGFDKIIAEAMTRCAKRGNEIADEYFTAVYGETGAQARAWLTELSERFDPPYLRHEKPRLSREHVLRYRELEADIRKKIPELEALAKTSAQWGRLVHHAKLSAQLAYVLSLYADSNLEVRTQMEKLKEMAYDKYYETHDSLKKHIP